MEKRGRKSAAAFEVVPIEVARQPIETPPGLKLQEKAIAQIVASVPASHFRKADVPLVASLATATYLVRFYAGLIGESETAFKQWTEATKLQMALATKLRLTPQSRLDRKAVGREEEPRDPGTAPWE